jgi:hypothetical protein
VTRRYQVLLTGVLLVAFVLRLYQTSAMALRADEATNVFLAAQNPADIIRPFITEDPHLPLYHIILHYWMLVAGQSELAVRFPTVFAGILIVALTVALSNTVFPNRRDIALFGALFAAINPYLIWDAQDAYMYSFLTALTLGSWIALLRALEPGASLAAWTKYVVAGALGLYFHYLAGLVWTAQGVLWLYMIWTRAISRRSSLAWVVAQAAIVLLFVPWLVLAVPLLSGFNLAFFAPTDLVGMLTRSFIAFSVGRAESSLMPPMVEPSIGGWLALGFFAIFLLGLVQGNQDVRGRLVLGISLFVPLLALYLFSILRFPIFDERYVLFLIPAFMLLLARGFTRLGNRWLAAGALLFMILASAHSLYDYFYVPAFAKSPDWQSFMQRLSAESRSGDVLIQNYPDPALPYYLQNRVPRVLLPRSSSDPATAIDADLDRLTGKFERVWLQPSPGATWDGDGLVATWLDRHALLSRAYDFRGLRLVLYLPASTALRGARPVDALFAGRIRLVAFDWDALNLRVVLYWQAVARVPRDATVFVHLYDRDGKLWSQQDNSPVHGTFPMSQWEPNEIVVDVYDLHLPGDLPPGEYELMVGMYDGQDLRRLDVVSQESVPENRVLLTQLHLSGGARR